LRTKEQAAFEAMRYLECNPEIIGFPSIDVPISVELFRGRYQILENGRIIEEAVDSRGVVDFVHARAFAYALRERPRSAIVHAALLRRGEKRLLIAGSRGSGKTTLSLRLAGMGFDLEGDEHVFIDRDGVVARPRGYRVKESAVTLLPDLAATILASPSYEDVRQRRIFNVDPARVGGPWRIQKGLVDCVIVLRPNHGGYSSLRPTGPMLAAQALISEMGVRDMDRGGSIAAVAALVGRAKTFDLSLGDHHTAIASINQALDEGG
jgi:energy-coupling factor transporter ATP-binding protein EcfA2